MRSVVFILIVFFSTHIYAQYEEFVAQYDILTTIAGKGEMDENGVGEWQVEYEGGPAIDAELARPHFAMADSSGNVYIADKESHAIRKVSPDGIITTAAGTNTAGFDGDGIATEHRLDSPNGIWVKADGTFFILDLGNDRIRKVDINGNLTTIVNDASGISVGRGLWVSQNEELIYYVDGTSVKKWTKDEGIVLYATGFSSPGHIIVDPFGQLVVTDRGANLVYRVKDDSIKTIIAGNGLASGGGNGYLATETGLYGVRGIWFMQDGSYLLATHEGSQIWYVDPSGIINLFLDGKEGDEYHSGDGEYFQTPGYKISEPRGVSVDYDGNILITENDFGFIRKIAKRSTTLLNNKENIIPESEFHIYPNPFNSMTTIEYSISSNYFVTVEIYSILGKKIKTLVNADNMAGNYKIHWNGTTDNNSVVGSGIYFCKINAGNQQRITRLLLIK